MREKDRLLLRLEHLHLQILENKKLDEEFFEVVTKLRAFPLNKLEREVITMRVYSVNKGLIWGLISD